MRTFVWQPHSHSLPLEQSRVRFECRHCRHFFCSLGMLGSHFHIGFCLASAYIDTPESRLSSAGGVLVLGLGCENNDLYEFKESLGEFDEVRVKFLVSQEVTDEIEAGVTLLKEIYENARDDRREAVPLSELKVGLKCGGSDGLSGITANPLLGRFSDFLVSQGGTTVLTEVPEKFGAEALLMERAADSEVFEKTVELINEFKEYFIENKQPVYENPTPGIKLVVLLPWRINHLAVLRKQVHPL